MSGIIQLLPDHVANQIAAGEVVQRPSSVVKELLENAIDARASHVILNIKEAGKTLIQVIDDGIGMTPDDAKMSFVRHATSKIKTAEDIFSIQTKGFRGEALASIAAVAQVTLKTRTENEELGTQIVVEGSNFILNEANVVPKGTSFSVKNLFFNIPARRNFLKSDTIEYKHIIDEFQRVVLAHPQLSFALYHNDTEVYNLPVSNRKQRIVNVFGSKTNEKLVPISEETDVVKLTGYVGKPEFSKKRNGEQFFFVNNRFIKSGYLHHAVMSAFEGLLKEGTKPSYYIYMEVEPSSIDVNIHPTKTEIKFDDEHTLYSMLRAAVKHSLGQFNVAPVLDFNRDSSLDLPYRHVQQEASIPSIEVDEAFNPFEINTKKSRGTSYTHSAFNRPKADNWDSLYVGLIDDFQKEPLAYESKSNTQKGNFLFENKEVEQSIFRTYQIHKKYIVTPIKSGMLVVDQQRAHQRVLYEQFLTNITVTKGNSQQLLFPLELYFSVSEIETLKEIKASLEQTGFDFQSIEKEKVVIAGLPIPVLESEASIVIDQLLSDIDLGLSDGSFSLNDKVSLSMAKSLAIKTGTSLTATEQEALINSLFACKEPTISPFSKPTYINISVEELDKKFAI